jgi:hypothetical protein
MGIEATDGNLTKPDIEILVRKPVRTDTADSGQLIQGFTSRLGSSLQRHQRPVSLAKEC